LWSVGLLGGLNLSDGQQHITRLPSRAVTALLARLALEPGRAHAREELIELLWPGVALDVGRNRLRQALSTLKGILEPAGRLPAQAVLQADRISVRVVAGALACDAVRFERDVRAGRADTAGEIYRGELLPGFYDDWICEERLRLASVRERLTVHGPRVPDVASEPAPPPLPPPQRSVAQRSRIPTYLTRMFGADEQVTRLRAAVLTRRLVTLTGPGGSGKTRLAVELAHQLHGPAGWPRAVVPPVGPFDLVAFVALLACKTGAQARDALTGALEIAPGSEDPLVALTDALAGRHVLLVLDNLEQIEGQAQELVAHLLAALPALHVMATSRRALGVDGECEFAVTPLAPAAADTDLDGAARNPAVTLFVDRARAVRADFHLSARNAATLVELTRVLGGMPLAIELAASRVRSVSPAEMLVRLRGSAAPRLDLLSRSGPRGAADPRHASMQRTIAWSWELLSSPQARLLSALASFAGSFTGAAAQALMVGESLDPQLLLDDLVANSLVHAHSDGDETLRFGLSQPIRDFAMARQDGAQARHWRASLRAWALGWAHGLPPTPPLSALRTEMPNLLAALASAVEDDAPQEAVELLLALRRCLEDVELPAEGLVHAQVTVERCADPLLQARGRTLLGPLLFTAGQFETATRQAELGLSCVQLDPVQRARALHALARVRWRSRRCAEEVEPLLDEADALLHTVADLGLRASVLALRAFVTNAHHRDHVAGERLHAQALALWEQLGNQHAVNSGRYNLAVCAQNANRHRAALARLEPIIASAQQLQDWRRLSQSLNVRGNAYSGLHEWAMAMADYQACVRTAWDTMCSFDLAYGLWNLPRALAHLRQPEAALRIAAHADVFWRTRFGQLSAQDQRYLQLVRRLVARQIDARRMDPLWHEGVALSTAQAVALTLSLTPTN
jgi:predicted ATPase